MLKIKKKERVGDKNRVHPLHWTHADGFCLGHIRIMRQAGQILSVLNGLQQSSWCSQHDSVHVQQEVENPA